MAFVALGDVVTATLYQSGEFTRDMTVYVWAIIAAAAVGLLASTLGRLYASTFYALQDTRTPLRFAVLRVLLTIGLGYAAASVLPPQIGLGRRWGVAGLTLTAGIAAWVEFALLRRALRRRIGAATLPASYLARLWGSAGLAAAVGWAVKLAVPSHHPIVVGLFSLGAYGITYLLVASVSGVAEARSMLGRVRRPVAR
jgi:putative peptidoglycan lipid II flippase